MSAHSFFKKISDILTLITDSPDKFSLKERVINIGCFIGIILTLTTITKHLILGFSLLICVLFILFLFCFIVFYILSRRRMLHHRYHFVIVLTIQFFIIVLYFVDHGSYGSMLYYSFIVILFVPFLYKKQPFIIFSFIVLTHVGLMLAEKSFVDVIVKPKNETMRLFDIYFSFLSSIVFTFLSLTMIIRYYDRERMHVLAQKNEIEEQKDKIVELSKEEQLRNESKLKYFTNISHELRTPLTLILSPLNGIIGNLDDDEYLKMKLKWIKKNAEKLKELTDQILDLRKIDTGNLRFDSVQMDIIPMLKETLQNFECLAEHKKLNYHYEVNINKLVMLFDPPKIEKVINNLLSNAFKFTDESGSISVRIEKIFTEEKQLEDEETGHKLTCNEFLLFEVSDNGMGISKDDLGNIFKCFYQAPDKKQGTGVGLSIAHEFIKQHLGHLHVASMERGTVFSFSIPTCLDKIYEATRASQDFLNYEIQKPVDQFSLVRPDIYSSNFNMEKEKKDNKESILLVDDDNEILEYLWSLLCERYQIIQAVNGRDAWNKLGDILPDLILSDVMMPEMDGFELCEKVKSSAEYGHIPVVLLTAKIFSKDRVDGYTLGADDYIAKPFDVKELFVRLENIFKNRKALREKFITNLPDISVRDFVVTKSDKDFIEKTIEIIKQGINDGSFGVNELLSELGMSRTLVHEKLKKLTNRSTTQFINVIRLNKAIELLSTTDHNITEVSYQVGFSDPSYFNRCFKKQFGINPSEVLSVCNG